MDINYSRILKYEWTNYLKDKTEAKLEKVKEIALKRAEVGVNCYEKRQTEYPVKYLFWHLHDMLVCYGRILNDKTKASIIAESIAEYLKVNQDQAPMFFKVAGIPNDRYKLEFIRDQDRFRKFLMEFCK